MHRVMLVFFASMYVLFALFGDEANIRNAYISRVFCSIGNYVQKLLHLQFLIRRAKIELRSLRFQPDTLTTISDTRTTMLELVAFEMSYTAIFNNIL